MTRFLHKLRHPSTQKVLRHLLQSVGVIAVCLGCFSAVEGADCRKWKKKSFFEKVTVDELIQCLELGYSPVSNGKHGSTPLHWASAYNFFNPMVIDALIDAGADVNAKFDDSVWGIRSSMVGDITPLHLAAGYNINPMAVKRLIARGADVEARDSFGRTPLHWASGGSMDPSPTKLTSESRSSLVVQALIDAGANVMARDDSGWTPLHWAADYVPQRAVLEVLVKAGANLAAWTKRGALPVDLAKRSHKQYLRDAWQALTPQQKEAARTAGDVYGHYARQERKKSQNSPGILDAVIAVAGGTAIAAAGGGTEEALEAGTVFAESVTGGKQPVGSTGGGIPSVSSTPGQSSGKFGEALRNLEANCGEKYRSRFSEQDHGRFYCLDAFARHCALKKGGNQQQLEALRRDFEALRALGGAERCPYFSVLGGTYNENLTIPTVTEPVTEHEPVEPVVDKRPRPTCADGGTVPITVAEGRKPGCPPERWCRWEACRSLERKGGNYECRRRYPKCVPGVLN